MSKLQLDNAPWNTNKTKHTFDFTVGCFINKDISIESDVLVEEYDEEISPNYNGDFVSDYKEQHYTITELMNEFVEMLKEKYDSINNSLSDGDTKKRKLKKIKQMIQDASGWNIEYIEEL